MCGKMFYIFYITIKSTTLKYLLQKKVFHVKIGLIMSTMRGSNSQSAFRIYNMKCGPTLSKRIPS